GDDASVRREPKVDGAVEPAEDDGVLEAAGDRAGPRLLRVPDQRERCRSRDQPENHPSPVSQRRGLPSPARAYGVSTSETITFQAVSLQRRDHKPRSVARSESAASRLPATRWTRYRPAT